MCSIDDLEDGKEYVVCGKGELFKKIEYKTDTLRSKKISKEKCAVQTTNAPKIQPPDCVRPRIVTLIRNGIKPRKVSEFCTLIITQKILGFVVFNVCFIMLTDE